MAVVQPLRSLKVDLPHAGHVKKRKNPFAKEKRLAIPVARLNTRRLTGGRV
jgi:hypothetical protein